MPVNGKLIVGERLDDWQAKPGTMTVVAQVTSGRMPTKIDLSAPARGSSTERCSLYGGRAHNLTSTAGIPRQEKAAQ